MKQTFFLLASGATPRQIRRGTVPKRLRRGKKAKAELKIAQTYLLAVVVHIPTLVWDMPTTIQGKSDKAWRLHAGIVNAEYSTFFTPQPTNPTPLVFSGYLDDYDEEIDNVKAKTSTPEDRDAAWTNAYIKGVKPTMVYAQLICDLHPGWASQIAAALGLRLKDPSISDLEDFAVKFLGSGSVELSGCPKKQRCIFQWQGTQNPSGASGWYQLDIPPSFERRTIVNDLAEGKWYFRMRKIYHKHVVGDWFPTISIMVKNS